MCFALTFVSNLEGRVVKQIMRRKMEIVPVRDWLMKSGDGVRPLFFKINKRKNIRKTSVLNQVN